LAEREERMAVAAPADALEEGEFEGEEGSEAAQSIDPELIRKLEEFKRQMFDPAHRGEAEGGGGESSGG
jgi:hypothetical protein